MRIFYINLDSRPDRRAKMDAIAERFRATTPSDLVDMNVKLDLRTLNNLKMKNKTSHLDLGSVGLIACFISHRKLWQKILDDGLDDAIILEDDAIVTSMNFPPVSCEKPFAWLGLRSSRKIKTNDGNLVYDRHVYGSHAYRVHRSLVPLLLLHSETLALSVDFFLNEVLAFHGIETPFHQLIKTNEFLSKSDIEQPPLITAESSKVWIFVLLAVVIVLILR